MSAIKKHKQRGLAFLAALIFMVVFFSFSAVMLQRSTANVAVAASIHHGNTARAVAESGLEMARYWLKGIHEIDNYALQKSELCAYALDYLQTQLQAKGIGYERQDPNTLIVPSVALSNTKSFKAVFFQGEGQSLTFRVTGYLNAGGQTYQRTIQSGYTFGVESKTSPYLGIEFGVATKSPLSLGNLTLDGFEIVNGAQTRVSTDVYIESFDQDLALIVKNAQISGDAKIANSNASASISGGQSSIGGEKGAAALNHVFFGVDAVDFPIPNPGHFEQYATGITINAANKGLYSTNSTLTNVRIAANTNPKFTGNVVVNGIMFIEQPNVVEFAGNATITGVIVGNGEYSEQSAPADNQINFTGTVQSRSVAQLSEQQFGGLTKESGTFLMAPGFSVSFGGNFGTLNGCIAANGVKTYGNAGGVIKGSIINYSKDNVMELAGKDLRFDRTGKADLPAGFSLKTTQNWVMNYNPSALYEEIVYADCGQ